MGLDISGQTGDSGNKDRKLAQGSGEWEGLAAPWSSGAAAGALPAQGLRSSRLPHPEPGRPGAPLLPAMEKLCRAFKNWQSVGHGDGLVCGASPGNTEVSVSREGHV